MAKYSSSWSFRRALTIDNTSGGLTTIDATVALPSTDQEFWDNVQSDGDDIKVFHADGVTAWTYDLNGFDTSTRSGTVEIDNASVTANKLLKAWMYFGNAAATDGKSAFVPASAKTGYVELGVSRVYIVPALPEKARDTRPAVEVVKTSNEVVYVDFDFTARLESGGKPYQGSTDWEEIAYLDTLQVLAANADQSAMYSIPNCRFIGRGIVRCYIQAGSSGTDYVISCRVVTVRPNSSIARTLEARALLHVRNTAE